MKLDTKVTRNIRKELSADSEITLKKLDDGRDLVFKIHTGKSYSGVTTCFSVCKRSAPERGFYSEEHAVFEDYMKSFRNPLPRVTEKTLREAHENAMDLQLEEQYKLVCAHYGIEAKVEEAA